MGDHVRSELVQDASEAALDLRGSLVGAIFHSDPNSHDLSRDLRACRRCRHPVPGLISTSVDRRSVWTVVDSA